jgi:hypothetical protein
MFLISGWPVWQEAKRRSGAILRIIDMNDEIVDGG